MERTTHGKSVRYLPCIGRQLTNFTRPVIPPYTRPDSPRHARRCGSAITAANGNGRALAAGIGSFGLLAALWWWYFDIADSTLPAGYEADPEHAIGIARDVHVLGHYVLVGAIVTVLAAVRPIIDAVAQSASRRPRSDWLP